MTWPSDPHDANTPPARYFTAANDERYRAAAEAAGVEELGVSEHVYRFRQSLDLWSHPLWESNGRDDLDAYCEFVRGTPLRLGIEWSRIFPNSTASVCFSTPRTSSSKC